MNNLKIEERQHYLSVLIELDLYPSLRVLTEGGFSKEQLDDEQQKTIIKFINRLPEEYRKMPNRDEIIIETLQRMGIQTMWGQKKMEERKMQEKLEKMKKPIQETKSSKEEKEK